MTIPGAPSDRPLGQRELVVMLALLMSLQALAIDGMLPALDSIARELGAGEGNRRQLVVATYLLAGGIGTLIPGALADRFGRRPVLLASIMGYSLLSLAIAFVHDFTVLLTLRGIQGLLARAGVSPKDVDLIVHGTTLPVNAVIQRRGAKVGLVVSRGNRDVLEIGRCHMPNPYDFMAERDEPLVSRDLVFETSARVTADGRVLAAEAKPESKPESKP